MVGEGMVAGEKIEKRKEKRRKIKLTVYELKNFRGGGGGMIEMHNI